MGEELERTVELIERLLSDPALRRRFRADAGPVLREHGLGELAAGLGTGRRALITLELRESRSSLAGVLVAAAAEGVDFTHMAEHAAPGIEHAAGRLVDQVSDRPPHHSAPSPAPPAEPPAGPPAHHAAPAAHHPAHHAAAPHHPRPDHHDLPPAPRPPADLLAYPGNAAGPQELAAWMGAHARRAGLPPELPVMAALTESGLRNLNYGDRDSVGFFQMRLGIWDEGSYAGYPEHPELQIQWFIDHALEVRAENPALAQSPSTWGEWVADVERPAAEYRYRYQLELEQAQALLRGADLSAVAPAAQAPASLGQAAVNVAMHYLSATGERPGMNSSALVQYAYAQEGLHLPGVAPELFDVGEPIARHALRPGDAVFFTASAGAHQVGLYIGHDRFVTTPEPGHRPAVSSLADARWSTTFAGARRYTLATLAAPATYARTLPTVKG